MNVRLSELTDNKHISKIWQTCFTDDQVYINNYLKYCLPYTRTWLLETNKNELASCLSIIPSYILSNNNIYRGGYLYGVGTLPEHRGNSYSRILINAAIEDCKKEGLCYLLVKPASESLYQFYTNASFKKEIFKGITRLTPPYPIHSADKSINISEISASELYSAREKSFAGSHFLWTEEILSYAMLEAKNRSGSCKKIQSKAEIQGSNIYYIAYPDETNYNRIKILETNAKNSTELSLVISAIILEYPNPEEINIESSAEVLNKSFCVSIEKSALLLSFNREVSKLTEGFHLSMPME